MLASPLKKLTRKLLPLAALAGLSLLWGSGPAHAWKPVTHVYFADLAVEDAKDNKVTIYAADYAAGTVKRDENGKPIVLGEYETDAGIMSAILSHYPEFRAGVLGPDAYPDIATGQQLIHPAGELTHDDPQGKDVNHGGAGTNPWLEHLWKRAYGPPGESRPEDQTQAIKAFVVGYMFHGAGDMYVHTFINEFAGGPFHFPENGIKHIVLEGYLTKRLPKVQDYNISIDNGVKEFIYRHLTYGAPGTLLEEKLLQGSNAGKSIPAIFTKMRNELQAEIDGYYAKKAEFDRRYDGRIALAKKKAKEADECGVFDFSCSKTVLYAKSAVHYAQAAAIQAEKLAYMTVNGPIATYKEHWRDDIDTGLKAFPILSHEIAKAMFFNPSGHADLTRVKALAGSYVTNHLLSMLGAPDAVGGAIEVINYVYEKIGAKAIKDALKQLKITSLEEFIIRKAFGMGKEELKEYFENPNEHFNHVLNNPKFNTSGGTLLSLLEMNRDHLKINDEAWNNPNEQFDIMNFAPAFNTLQMTKMILMKPSEVNRLMADLGSAARLDENPSVNAILGFLRSLDSGNQWHVNSEKMVAAREGDAYRKIFAREAGDLPVGHPQLEITPGYYELKPNRQIAFSLQPHGTPVNWSVVNPLEGGIMGDGAPNVYRSPQRVAENTTITVKATATDGTQRYATTRVLLVASPPRPQIFTWTGGGSDGKWNNPYNWGSEDYYPGEPGFEDKDTAVLGALGWGEVRLATPIKLKELKMGGGRLIGEALTISGSYDWTGGYVSNRTEVLPGAIFNITGEKEKTVYGTVATAGMGSWSGAGNIKLLEKGVFENTGEFEMKDGGEISGNSCCVSPTQFINRGTFIKSGEGDVKVGLMNFVNHGTAELKQGNLELGVGLHGFAGGSTFTGPGRVNVNKGTLTLSGEVNAGAFSHIEVRTGSNMKGEQAKLKGTPVIDWIGGNLYGQIELPESGILNVSGDTLKSLYDTKLINAGTINWTGTGHAAVNAGTEITNAATGVIEFESDMEVYGTVCCVSPAKFINRGVITKEAGTGTTKLTNFTVLNSGTMNVKSGTLEVGKGPHRFENGTVLSGQGKTLLKGGTTELLGAMTVNGGHTLEMGYGATLIGGEKVTSESYQGTGTIGGDGTFNWAAYGRLEGNLTFNAPLTTRITGAEARDIYKGKIVNAGTLIWTDNSSLRVTSATTFTNAGVMAIQGDVQLFATSCCTNIALFENTGQIVMNPAGTAKFSLLRNVNAGRMEIKSGLFEIHNGSFTQTAGDLKLNGGAIKTNTPLQIQGGTVSGTGKITGLLKNIAGVVSPGHSPGVLTIEGDYVQEDTGTLQIEIAGENPGTEYDQLEVIHHTDLRGQLSLTLPNGYQPDLGDGFRILKYGSLSGAFAKVTGTYVGGGKGFTAEVTPTGLTLHTVGDQVGVVVGDLDGNGMVQVTDAMKALRIAVGLEPNSPAALEAGDVAPKPGTGPRAGQPYGDGQVTVADAIRILRKIVGVETDWP
ncbi:MAG: hypothetical protein KY468_06290 [Armatimonadetes bacterium]|nr:hypothetical protein [Armatimonadota bacterium]